MTNDDRFRLDQAPATEADWRDAVDGVLKGRPFAKVLVNETRGGLDIQPLYEPPAGTSIVPAGRPQRIAYGWDIRQHHGVGDLDACRAAVLDDLEHGVTSIELGTPRVRGTSTPYARRSRGFCSTSPRSPSPPTPTSSAPAPSWRSSMSRAMPRPPARGSGSIRSASSPGRGRSVTSRRRSTGGSIAETHPNVVACTVDTTRYVDAGADEVQELTWMLATGVAVLRALEAAGMPVERAAATIGFRVSADGDQFLTIARLRAARRLWASVLAACGVDRGSPPVPGGHYGGDVLPSRRRGQHAAGDVGGVRRRCRRCRRRHRAAIRRVGLGPRPPQCPQYSAPADR